MSSRIMPAGDGFMRTTKEGRKLKYCLNVIQQPERARACGSGAKSSADRRPVDPPPVAELRIFDVTNEPQDVTFAYDANFFLFATLEVARPMAHGRLPAPPPQIPVLTGMPVSGMAYLDRPAEAGYFIFPDLSVRHEGKYKLSFNLYEETKDDKDADVVPSVAPPSHGGPLAGSGLPDSSFDWRMEVKSNSFTVFSAKKFPGLTESTLLSKTVAEQGCRVRIRRDVRMRRRDGKEGGDFLEAGEEYVRPERHSTPTDHEYRRLPIEVAEAYDSRHARHESQSRRTSIDYANHSYPPQSYTPSSVSSHASSAPVMGYQTYSHASSSASSSQYATSTSNAPSYQPIGGMEYHRAGQYRPAPQPMHNSNSSNNNNNYAFGSPATSDRSGPPPPPPSRDRDSFDPEFRRPSFGGFVSTSLSGMRAPALDGSSQHVPPPHSQPQQQPPKYHHPSYATTHAPIQPSPAALRSPVDLPPFKSIDHGQQRSPVGPLAPVSNLMGQETVASSTATAYHGVTAHMQMQMQIQATPPTIATDARGAGKRAFDSVFHSTASKEPLFNGRRPSTAHHHILDIQEDDDDDDDSSVFSSMERLKMQYKRADGSKFSRQLPPVQ